MAYPNPYGNVNNGLGSTSSTAPLDLMSTQGTITPQAYIESLLDMAKFTKPSLPVLNGLGNIDTDMAMDGWQPPEFNPMAAMTDAGGATYAINPTMWGKIKQGGSDLVGSFMPKINAETGKLETLGWGMPALQGLSSLGNLYLGMKNYGLAKDQLRTQKDQFNMNYNNQRQLLNTQMEDRQRTEAGGSSKAESVDSYMARNRIK
mgnify:FL=1